jgi:hypothetical protein
MEHEPLDRQQFEEVMEGKAPAGLGQLAPTPSGD